MPTASARKLKPQQAETPKVRFELVAYKRFEKFKETKGNPRGIESRKLDAVCQSLAEFQVVEPFVVREETETVIGGHQRKKAVARLLAKAYVAKRSDGSPIEFELDEVPVMFVSGLTDKQALKLNIALNNPAGEWDYGLLATAFKEITGDGQDLGALSSTGFSEAEAVDILEAWTLDSVNNSGSGAAPSTGAPKLTLDFSTVELRDAVKSAIAAANKLTKGVSGDVLAKLLNVRKPRK